MYDFIGLEFDANCLPITCVRKRFQTPTKGRIWMGRGAVAIRFKYVYTVPFASGVVLNIKLLKEDSEYLK